MECDCSSVKGEYVLEYLKQHKHEIYPCCPLCGGRFEYKFYTDGRDGFICEDCKASGTNYVGGG